MSWSQCGIRYCKPLHTSRSGEKLLWHHRHSTRLDIILPKNRKLSVHIDDFSLNTKTINFSVPQDSILGPILFNCWVSTPMEIIPETEDNFVSGYADDHALINTFDPENTDISHKLVSNISCIKDWMDRNQLKMNGAKTEFTVFGSKHQVQRNGLKSLNIDNTIINAKSAHKIPWCIPGWITQHEDSHCQQVKKCTV